MLGSEHWKNNPYLKFGVIRLSKKFLGHQAKLQNSASMKIRRDNMLIKGPVPLFGLARKVQPDALYTL